MQAARPAKGLSRGERLTLIALLAVFFIDNFGIALVYPIFTPLILISDYGITSPDMALATKVLMLGGLIAAFPAAQFFGAPILGNIADLIGRKRAFFFTLLGEAVGYFLSGVGVELKSYALLIISRLITGFFAGNLIICLTGLSDLSPTAKERSRHFGYLAMVGGISFVIAILIGGEFSDRRLDPRFNSALPFWIAAALALFNLYIVFNYYRDGIKKRERLRLSFTQFFRCYTPLFTLKSLVFPTLSTFFFMLGWIAALQFLSYFILESYTGNKQVITLFLLMAGTLWAIGNGLINHLLQKGLRPKTSALISLFFAALSSLFVTARLPFHSFILFFALLSLFASLSWTNLIATISLDVPPAMQGKTLGFVQGVTILAVMLSPFLGASLIDYGSQTIFLFITISIFISFIFLLFQFIFFKKTSL